MRIGIDCDGVLRDFIPALIDSVKETHPEHSDKINLISYIQVFQKTKLLIHRILLIFFLPYESFFIFPKTFYS